MKDIDTAKFEFIRDVFRHHGIWDEANNRPRPMAEIMFEFERMTQEYFDKIPEEQRDPNLVKLVETVREASKEKWIKA